MGGFKRIEDRPTPKEVYNWRVYMLACVCGMSALTFGYDGAFIGTTIARPSFKHAFGIDKMTADEQKNYTTNLTATFTGSAFFGAVFAWPVMEAWGRKRPMQVSALLFNVGAILMTVTTHSLGMIFAGRAITGFAVGILTAVVPTFISEFAPPPIRGQLTGFFEIAYQAGSLVGFWINYGITSHMDVTQNKAWRVAMAVQLIPGGMLLVASIVLRESPGWLLRKGREEQCLSVLSYVRQLPADHRYIKEEIALLMGVIGEERRLSGGKSGILPYLAAATRELRIPSLRNRFVILFVMFILMNFSGAVVLNYYSPTLFGAVGITGTDIFLYTGYYGLVKAVGAITFCLWIVDRSGRRLPWLLSASSCAVCLIYMGAFVEIAKPSQGGLHSASSIAGGKGAIAAIMLYSWFWSWGGNSLAWIVSAELFPISLRSFTGAFGASTQWLSSFAATMSAPHMFAKCGGYTFIFYGLCCLLTWVFTFFWIPETKGIPIECMGPLFDGPSRHCQFRQKKVYPPNGIPPPPPELAQDAIGRVDSTEKKPEFAHVESVHSRV
ncbi:putative quinate permease [Vanrija pseudolonga]|uniref:Quinate permease n=1 Tax=Vanrija pseudolonga TaxID=143232 RepID=A0AAF1BRW2_9TREE|nr:putative quinate permease [Vanrija pseudolonga]